MLTTEEKTALQELLERRDGQSFDVCDRIKFEAMIWAQETHGWSMEVLMVAFNPVADVSTRASRDAWVTVYGEPKLCKHCAREVFNVRDQWWHRADAGELQRGCRSASWSEGNGWDEKLPKGVYAAVAK